VRFCENIKSARSLSDRYSSRRCENSRRRIFTSLEAIAEEKQVVLFTRNCIPAWTNWNIGLPATTNCATGYCLPRQGSPPGGFPLSPAWDALHSMDAAWPPASGEAIHTSTYLGNPVGCAWRCAKLKIWHGGWKHVRTNLGMPASSDIFCCAVLKSIKPPQGYEIEALEKDCWAGVEFQHAMAKPATNWFSRHQINAYRATFAARR